MKRIQAVIATALFGVCAQASGAQELVFHMDNEYFEDVGVEFYSLDRNHVWPGGDEVWVLGPTDGVVSYPLACRAGELICFGAWTIDQQSQWGAGSENTLRCEACCFYCNNIETEVIELN